MRANAFVDHTDEINSPYALVPIIVYCFDKAANTCRAEIARWLSGSSIPSMRTLCEPVAASGSGLMRSRNRRSLLMSYFK
jgi:hypothetical protein